MAATATEITILRHLCRRRDGATASQIGAACGLIPAEARALVAHLETERLVSSRPGMDAASSRSVYMVTADGRRAAGIGHAG